jgi:hypothetical protein
MTRTPSVEGGTERRGASLARALTGIVLVLIGGVALGALIYVSNSRDPDAEHAMIALGLAGSVLVSAIAQAMVVVGLYLLWRTARPRRG